MKIHEYFEIQFAQKLDELVSPSSPIRSFSHLKGRQAQYDTVREAVYARGRHVLIFGERGVGKTSLATTAGLSVVESKADFKQIGCATDTTIQEICRQIVEHYCPDLLKAETVSRSLGIASMLGLSKTVENTTSSVDPASVSEIVDVLCRIESIKGDANRVVVIDEIDRLSDSSKTREKLAELSKLLGDRASRITIILTGVARDVDEILGAHASAYRQFTQVPLGRLDFGGSLQIVQDAFTGFSIDFTAEPCRSIMFRIASIANGFPYYAHLIVERILYALYRDKDASIVTLDHLKIAIDAAVEKTIQEIRKPYDMAVRGREDAYKWLVWSVADSWDLERSTKEIDSSFRAVCEFFNECKYDQATVSQRLASLKKKSFGELLVKGYRAGQHSFKENLVRGYARLCAAAEDVELNSYGERTRTDPSRSHAKIKRFFDASRIGSAPAGFGSGFPK